MSENDAGNPTAGSASVKSVDWMTLRVPLTAVPAAAVGDSVAVSVPVAPGASSTGVAVAPPVMSLPDGSSTKSPTWFVVFLTCTVIGTLAPVATVVDADVGRPDSVTGASRLYETTPVTVWENTVPSVVAPCITSISHRPGWGSGAISEAFPVGLSAVGVVSVAVTSMKPDSVTPGSRSAGENR